MRSVTLPGGERVPALGLGTWMMGERGGHEPESVAALKRGIDLGMTLIDTAEMYGDGGAEELVGQAIAGQRDRVFIVSKVLPSNASRTGVTAACERSLKRLGTDRIDLYLLHWRGGIPLHETVAGFVELRRAGKIRHWGVSNLDLDEMKALWAVPGGENCATNQLLYNLGRRGIEWDLRPALSTRGVPVMAYSPLEQGQLLGNATLKQVAAARGATPAQVALAWLLQWPDVIVIPKAANLAHVADNCAAAETALTPAEYAALERAFPPPRRKMPLAML
ncbi:MAG TPA: aldo/keto reductase [Stellaceae bacterium]|nr:aldo/keto reductase [Stellaceae bacterium]